MIEIVNKGKTDKYVYDISLDGTVVNALGCNICSNTDGFNFKMPSDEELQKRHYIGKGLNRDTVEGKEYFGVEADVAEFDDLFMRGKMGLGIDEYAAATINFSRKNYSDLLINNKTGEKEIKLVGNTIKSKKMPVYIEKFLQVGIDLLLNKKGQEFLDTYYNYIEKIYNYQIPLKEIASKGKIKKTLEEYVNDCQTLTKAGTKKSRQVWYELLLMENPIPNVEMAQVIYYINTGKHNSDADVKKITKYYKNINNVKTDVTKDIEREFNKYKKTAKNLINQIENKDKTNDLFSESYEDNIKDYLIINNENGKYELKYLRIEMFTDDKKNRSFINSPLCKKILGDENIFSEEKIYVNCKLLPNKIVDSEEDIMCDENMEYNCEKYILQFNKRITPLLVCFKPEIRDKILITTPKDRKFFTIDKSVLDSGHPIRPTDQDTIEEIMTPSRMEIEYWIKVNEIPPFVDEIGMDWNKIVSDYNELIKKEQDIRFIELNQKYYDIITHLTEEEVDNFMEDFTIPSKLLQLVYIDEKNPCPTFKFKEMPSMSPSTGGIIFDDICYDVINGTKENNLNEEFND